MNQSNLAFRVGQTVMHRLNKTPMIIIEAETGMRRISMLTGPIGPVTYTGRFYCTWYENSKKQNAWFHQSELILIDEKTMGFSAIETDIVSLLKASTGEQIDDIMACIATGKISISRSDLIIKSGDIISKKMSNGETDSYKVIDPGYHDKYGSIPAGYDITVKKMGIPEADNLKQEINYHLYGHNTRINNNSIDRSRNTVNINNQIDDKISELKNEIEKLNLSKIGRDEALELIQALAEQVNSASPSAIVIKSIIAALPNTANIASIGSFLLEAIKQ